MGFKLVNCINDIQLMVDRQRRKKLTLHLRHLSTGLISNDEFEERVMDEVTYGWLPEQYHKAYQRLGVYEVWPFFTRQDYESALGKHPFLQQQDHY